MSGCPTHVATLEFQTSVSTITFDDGRGQRITNWPTTFEAMISMLVELAGSRGEIEDLLVEGLRGSAWDNRHD
jgi:hypothetical protein